MDIHSPKNTIRRIDAVWMAVSVDSEDNTEGVCAANLNGMMVPLIAADEDRLPWVIEQATLIARASFIKVKLIKLHMREELMTFEGKPL